MTTEQTTEEKTARYEAVLETIRSAEDGDNYDTAELQWFAETSMDFATTLGTVFSEVGIVIRAINALLTAIAEHTDPKTMHSDVVAAVMACGILLGHMGPEDIAGNEAQEVLQ